MASNYTSNYNLCQWAASDKVLRTEFNADNAKIDAALAGLSSGKSDKSALNSLTTTVNGLKTSKADKSTVDSLSQTLSQGMELRNCRVVTGSYKGAGTYGPSHPNTLTFSQKPVFVCVVSPSSAAYILLVRNQTSAVSGWSNSPTSVDVKWTDRSVAWNVSDTLSSSAGPTHQLNNSSTTYFYFAALEVE